MWLVPNLLKSNTLASNITSLTSDPQQTLPNFTRLERWTLPWPHYHMGIYTPGSSLHARLLSKSWPTFPLPCSHYTTTSTLPPYNPHLWHQTTICWSRGQLPITQQNWQDLWTRGHRGMPLLHACSWLHHANSPQVPCHSTIHTNPKHLNTSQTLPWLCHVTPRCHGNISSQWHDPCCPQWCILPLWNNSMQSNWWPLLPFRKQSIPM